MSKWVRRLWLVFAWTAYVAFLVIVFFGCQIGIACYHGGDNPPGGQYETPILVPAVFVLIIIGLTIVSFGQNQQED